MYYDIPSDDDTPAIECNCFPKILGINTNQPFPSTRVNQYSEKLLDKVKPIKDSEDVISAIKQARDYLLWVKTHKGPRPEAEHDCVEAKRIIGRIKRIYTQDDATDKPSDYNHRGDIQILTPPPSAHESQEDRTQETTSDKATQWSPQEEDTEHTDRNHSVSHGIEGSYKQNVRAFHDHKYTNEGIIIRTTWEGYDPKMVSSWETLESVRKAPKALRKYIEELSTRGRNTLLRRYPALITLLTSIESK